MQTITSFYCRFHLIKINKMFEMLFIRPLRPVVLHGSSTTWFQTSNLIQSNGTAVAENKIQK